MRDDRPMRRLAPISDRLAVGAVLALAIFVLAKAHRSVDYWTVAWPGVLTGCGTLALAAVTYRVLVGDQEDRRKRDLHDQKQAERERRAQAEAISGWYAGEEDTDSDTRADSSPPTKMFLLNRSDSPVYRVVVTLAFLSGTPPKTGEEWVAQTGGLPYAKAFGSLPPGRWRVDTDSGWGALGARPGVEVAFTDRSGQHWIRRADGRLDEVSEEAMSHYGVPGYFSLEGIGDPAATA